MTSTIPRATDTQSSETRTSFATLRLALFLLVFLLATILISARAAEAQSSQNTSNQGDIAERVDVRVVNVEAVVTDKHGVRIHDLGPEDFRLMVDGEETPIDFFTEVRGGEALAGPSTSGIAPISREQQRGTSYLVFLDEMFSIAAHRNVVLDSLEDQLNFLGPDDRMAVVAWDGRRLDMLTSWTNDQRTLKNTLRTARERHSRGLEQIAERNALLSGTTTSYAGLSRYGRSGRFGNGADLAVRAYVERLTLDIEGTVDAASGALRAFAFPPGRKVLTLVSGGWAFNPVDFVAGFPTSSRFDYGTRYSEGPTLYQPLIETANLLGYTIYPVDAPGLQSTGSSIHRASYGGGQFGGNLSGLNFYREDELHYTLRYLADQTGGRALINSQRNKVLPQVSEDTRTFYWLGFTPERTADGLERTIEVEVLQPKLKVRSRGSYTDLTSDTEVTTAVESSLLFGDPIGKPLTVALGSPQKSKRGRMTVPLRVEIPVDQIALLPVSANGFAAEVEVRVAAINDRGDRSGVPVEVLRLSRDEMASTGEVVVYETDLQLRRQNHDLVVAVYDPASGELFSTTTSVRGL